MSTKLWLMQSPMSYQYELVLDSRTALFAYCSSISPEDFVRSSANFGKGGSIRNLMVHICNTYQGWLAEFVPGRAPIEMEHADVPGLKECIDYFNTTNELVFAFTERFKDNFHEVQKSAAPGEPAEAVPLKLFTHVITHEFHHKGQILSLSRLWGYTPVDTDILR